MVGRSILIGVVFISYLLSSCSNSNDFDKLLNEDRVLLRFDQSRKASKDDLFLLLEEITDSRCPVGAVCTSNGKAIVNIKASFKGDVEHLNFDVCGNCGDEGCIKEFKNHRIEILNVYPYPSVDYPIENINDYTIEIKVTEL